jgi:hypothetical protein
MVAESGYHVYYLLGWSVSQPQGREDDGTFGLPPAPTRYFVENPKGGVVGDDILCGDGRMMGIHAPLFVSKGVVVWERVEGRGARQERQEEDKQENGRW